MRCNSAAANTLDIDDIYLGPNEPAYTGNISRATTALLQFAGSTGGVTIRDSSGTAAANMYVGTVNRYYSNIVANVNLSGHTADLLLNTLNIGSNGTGNATYFYARTGAMTFNSGTLNVTSVILGTSAGGNGTLNIGGGLTTVGSGGITIASGGTGALNLTGGTVTLGADIVQTGGTTAAGALTLNGAVLDMGGHNIGGATPVSTLNFYSGTLQNVAEINAGASGLTMSGTGTLILTGSNTYTGGNTVNAGLLQLGSSTAITAGPVQVNSGRLDLGAYDANAAGVTLVSGTISGVGTATLSGTSFGVQDGLISAHLAGPGGLTKTTSGTVTLAAANAYLGLTDVQNGVLQLGTDQAIPGDLQTSGGTLDLNVYSTTAGTVTVLSGAITGSGTATLSGSAYNVQSGSISANLGDLGGPGSVLTKTTSGTLVLSGSDGYLGGTVVNGGTLLVTNSQAIYDGTNLSVGDQSLLATLAPVVPLSAGHTIAAVPEPGTLGLLTVGAILAGWSVRRRKKSLET